MKIVLIGSTQYKDKFLRIHKELSEFYFGMTFALRCPEYRRKNECTNERQ